MSYKTNRCIKNSFGIVPEIRLGKRMTYEIRNRKLIITGYSGVPKTIPLTESTSLEPDTDNGLAEIIQGRFGFGDVIIKNSSGEHKIEGLKNITKFIEAIYKEIEKGSTTVSNSSKENSENNVFQSKNNTRREKATQLSNWSVKSTVSRNFDKNKEELWVFLKNKLGLTPEKKYINLVGFRLEREENEKLELGTYFSGMWMSGSPLEGEITQFDEHRMECELSLIGTINNKISRRYKFRIIPKNNSTSTLELQMENYLTGGLSSIFLWITSPFFLKWIAKDTLSRYW